MVIRNWILYIMTVVSLAVFSILYIKQSGFMILVMAVVVPPLYSALVFVLMRKRVTVTFGQEVLSAQKSHQIEIPVMIRCGSEIARGSEAVLYVTVANGMGTEVHKMKKKVSLLLPREEVLLTFVPAHSGLSEVSVDKVKIYNGFSLFRSIVRPEGKTSFLVMPEYQKFPVRLEAGYEEKEGESEQFSSVKAGNDPSELYDIRSYCPGDKMNRINWKLSAKRKELMVQDYGFPIACDLAVVIDVADESDLAKIEKVIEIVYFLAMQFTMSKQLFYVVWKDYNEKRVKRKMIREQEEIYGLFMEIFRSGMVKYHDPVEDIYSAQYEGEYLTGCIFVETGRGKLEDEIVKSRLRTDVLEFVRV